jgi:adsorption protein B
MLTISFAAFVWRALWRFGFTASEYGLAEGILAVLRIPVANVIAIMAGRRALVAYARSLAGSATVWDKTTHSLHPAHLAAESAA